MLLPPGMHWFLILCLTLLFALGVVAAVVPICDLPYSPYSDEFTVLQALRAAGRAELRKRRAATALDVKVMMLGLDGSGKSSLVEYWLRGEASSKAPAPTAGFNIQELNEPAAWWAWKGGVRLNVWELGGAAEIRPYWSRCAATAVHVRAHPRLHWPQPESRHGWRPVAALDAAPACWSAGISTIREQGQLAPSCSPWTAARRRGSLRPSRFCGRLSIRECCRTPRPHSCCVSQRPTPRWTVRDACPVRERTRCPPDRRTWLRGV